MPSSLTDIFTVLQNGVIALGKIAKSLSTTFPQVTGTSSTATAGALTFNSSQPTTFITIVSTSGATLKIPAFLP
jgi:hypothetical protein